MDSTSKFINNPRFPHYVVIERALQDIYGSPVTDEETGEEIFETVFESVCGLRDMVRGLDIDKEVVKADYKLSLPKHTSIIKNLYEPYNRRGQGGKGRRIESIQSGREYLV